MIPGSRRQRRLHLQRPAPPSRNPKLAPLRTFPEQRDYTPKYVRPLKGSLPIRRAGLVRAIAAAHQRDVEAVAIAHAVKVKAREQWLADRAVRARRRQKAAAA